MLPSHNDRLTESERSQSQLGDLRSAVAAGSETRAERGGPGFRAERGSG